MRLLLLSPVKKLGKAGDEVLVKDGFGRYLVCYKLALRATPENVESFKKQKEVFLQKQQELLETAGKVHELLDGATLSFIRSAGRDGRLFGSVSKKDIALEASRFLAKSIKASLTHDQVLLTKPIKESGLWNVTVLTHHGLPETKVFVKVAGSEELLETISGSQA
jgi:large subunit ribosomal protein L9